MKETEEIKIKYLKWPESVRQRSGMYAGSLDNPDVLLREICDNSQDELAQGYGDTIVVSNDFNGYCMVLDNGRGMPITMADGEFSNITQTKLSVTTIHSGSKFGASGDSSRVGMNGCAQAVVNALSERFIIMSRITPANYNRSTPEVERLWNQAGPRSKKDLFYVLIYEKGVQKFEGACKLKDIEKQLFTGDYVSIPEGQSTIVLFKADPELYESTKAEISYENLQYFLLIQEKFYNRKVNIVVNGEVLKEQFKPYQFEVLETIVPKDNSVNKSVGVYITFEVDDKNLNTRDIIGSINGLPSAGLHITTAENCFKAALKNFYKIKRDTTLTNGLKMCVVLLAQEVLFSSQTKENLKSITKVKAPDFAPVVKAIEKVFKKNPDYWEGYVAKLQLLADSLKDIGAAEKAQRIIDNASNANQLYRNKQNLVDGFVDATGTDRWGCELMLCFTGDTEILTCNNEKIKFIDLVRRINSGEDIYTLSCTGEGEIFPSKITAAKKIATVSRICKVILDNEEFFQCTPDHRIMMRDGTYKEAKDLVVGDSLMPISNNCKVVSTEIFDVDNEPVYCLEVNVEEHNFPLAAGIFVRNCEGLSPAGALKNARKSEEVKRVAILPLRGKVLDVSGGVTASKMLDNAEFYTIFSSIGLGIDQHSVIKDAKSPKEAYEIIKHKTRYGKLVIATDSDEDGLSIQKGILFCISKFARFMIDFGMVFIAESPIYEQFGKYYYPSDPRIPGNQFCMGMDPSKHFRRFKGLGALNREDVYKSFYDSNTRRLIQVTPDNIDYAMGLVENIDMRKQLLANKGILTNPYGFNDL